MGDNDISKEREDINQNQRKWGCWIHKTKLQLEENALSASLSTDAAWPAEYFRYFPFW